jgi:parallel beta-helix repeat protein
MAERQIAASDIEPFLTAIDLENSAYNIVDDGTTNNASAFATFLSTVPANSVIDMPPGIVCIGSAGIVITSKTKLTGAASNALSSLGNFAIKLDSCASCFFEGTTFIGNSQGSIIGFISCTDSGLKDCDISGAGTCNAQMASINSTRSCFINNIVHDSGGSATRGMWIGNVNTTEVEYSTTVKGNRVYSNTATGIVTVAHGGVFTNNTAQDNAGAGIIFSGNDQAHSIGITISNNFCSGNTFHGIQADSGDLSHALAYAYCPRGTTIAGNVCWNNVFDGIYIADAVDTTVSNNVCYDNGNNGIHLDTNVFGASVCGNICFDTRTAGSRTQDNGIRAIANSTDTMKHITISGNTCRNHVANGIFAQSNTGANMKAITINGNACSENSTDGIFLAEAAAGLLTGIQTGNACLDNTTVDIRNTTTAVLNGTSYFVTKSGF